MKTNKKGISKGKLVGMAAGLVAVGAGAYYFAGPNGKKNQKKVKVLAGKIKKEGGKALAKAKKDFGVVKNKAKVMEKLAIKTLKDLNK
ncbi:MAG: hypothetical protein KBD55_01810 [Candidatus Pacebacteria bacterium]|nr:hypothetical protein [Candidatus Paceibacterota bacterium]